MLSDAGVDERRLSGALPRGQSPQLLATLYFGPPLFWRSPGTRRVQFVRGEGRDVSSQYRKGGGWTRPDRTVMIR